MIRDVIVRPNGEIVAQEPGDFPLLDVYGDIPLADEPPRVDALATISAGYREKGANDHWVVKVSRDGTVYLHESPARPAPGLKAALAARGNKSLTIAFPFDNPAAFIQQRFVMYSATHLLAYGDEAELTRITPGGNDKQPRRDVYQVGTAEYDALRAQCKVSVSIYFALAEWLPNGQARVNFPDGLGLYRLRSTSRNTVRNLRAAITTVSKFTHGRLQGIPFDIALDYRDVAGPDGSRRNVPCFTFTMRPPQALTSGTFVPLIGGALREGARMMIAPPGAEGEDTAESDLNMLGPGEDPDEPSERQLQTLSGERCDPIACEHRYFGTVKGTSLYGEEGRMNFVHVYTHGTMDSLADFFAQATLAQADDFLIEAAQRALEEMRDARPDWQKETPLPQVHGVDDAGALHPRPSHPDAEPPRTRSAQPPTQEPSMEPPGAAEAAAEAAFQSGALTPESTDAKPPSKPTNRDFTDYNTLMLKAAALGIDLEPYQPGEAPSKERLTALAVELRSAIDAKEAE